MATLGPGDGVLVDVGGEPGDPFIFSAEMGLPLLFGMASAWESGPGRLHTVEEGGQRRQPHLKAKPAALHAVVDGGHFERR